MNNICNKKVKILNIGKEDAYFDIKDGFIGKYAYISSRDILYKEHSEQYYSCILKVIEKNKLVYHTFMKVKLEFKEKNCANCEDKLKCITGELDF